MVRLVHSASSTSSSAPGCRRDVAMPFIKRTPSKVLQEALAADQRLEVYADAFAAEDIDPDMAHHLSLNDLRIMLPSASVGDCLRLRTLFQSLPTMMRALPDPREAPGWCFPAQFISTGALEGNLAEKHFKQSDHLALVSSLMVLPTIEIGILSAPPCDPSDGCTSLLYADFCLWLVTAFCYLSTITLLLQLGVSDMLKMAHEWPQHFLDHWYYFMQPVSLFITGTCCLCAALCTRVYVTLDHERGVMAICCFVAFFVFFWFGSFSFRMKTLKLPLTCRHFFAHLASQMGFILPRASPPEAYPHERIPAGGHDHSHDPIHHGRRVSPQ